MAQRSHPKNESQTPEAVVLQVEAEAKPDTPFYYVNFASVGHSQYEFVISVLRLPTSLTPEQIASAKKGNRAPLEPTLQLVIPPALIQGFITALTVQHQQYENEFGPIAGEAKSNDDPEKQ